tara:strand:+ start:813 stop:935 length:123 start_codon:yes stop_codon:yes gene_type:complete
MPANTYKKNLINGEMIAPIMEYPVIIPKSISPNKILGPFT